VRYVLVHGAWHTGDDLACVAASIRAGGHEPFTPTIKGNRPGDPKTIGLAQAIRSIVDYLAENNLSDVVLVGHSYGGMIITGVADSVPERIRRLVYWNAFVPNDGESVSDMLPLQYVNLFEANAAERCDGSVVLLEPPADEDVDRQDFPEDQSFRDGRAEILRQLHRRHFAASSLPMAPSAITETGLVPIDTDPRQP
jgi:pimeloyl-ACP methyl ester carboxylesterase